MKKQFLKSISRLTFALLLQTCIIGISLLINGIPLMGVPSVEQVKKVTIAYPKVTEEIKEFSDQREIQLAINLTNFLKYTPFARPENTEGHKITITYYLQNGQSISLSADEETLSWKGKNHLLKEKQHFVKLTEGVFFAEEARGEQYLPTSSARAFSS